MWRPAGGLVLSTTLLLACAAGRPEPPRKAADEPPRGFRERGLASWYGEPFHGRATASGEIFDMNRISAAHKTLPLGTVVRVRNLENNRTLDVRINDRGPFVKGRIIDLSRAAAEELDMLRAGVVKVEIRVVQASATGVRVAPADRPPPPAGKHVALQFGAFRDKKNARDLARRLADSRPPPRVYSRDGWHRVQVRGLSRKRAESLREKLAGQGVEAVLVAVRP